MMKRIFGIALACLGIALVVSCDTRNTTQSGSYKMLYDYQTFSLHPEYRMYHFTTDSTRLYFRVQTSELLYTRTSSDSPFQSQFSITITAYKEDGSIEDSTSMSMFDQARSTSGWLLGSIGFKMSEGVHNVIVDFKDIKKNSVQTHYLVGDKSSVFAEQNYLPVNSETNEVVFGKFLPAEKVIRVESARNKIAGRPIYAFHSEEEIKLPPPPFSSNKQELPDVAKMSAVPTEEDSIGAFVLMEKGITLITCDTSRKAGMALGTSSNFFPDVKMLDQLTPPLRYITTKVEFDEITNHYFPKTKVDEFWMECAGSKDRARDLIRVYYNRVQEANRYFSSYTEGWRTDRGMIHVIFGNPSRIIKQRTYENWIYGEEGQATMLTFVFNKQEHPIYSNYYVLNRDPGFKQFWERQVTAWRTGRIYGD